MAGKAKKYIAIVVVIWNALIGLSAFWNVTQALNSQREIHLENARSLFNLIVITRAWNSLQGGVYVPVTDSIQPNPYLTVPDRDVTTTSGVELTKLNPAYMTRLIAELADQSDGIKFHITSLKPIRPENKAFDWETTALTSFELDNTKEYYAYYDDGSSVTFRYMAPLITQQSCLACHEKQGYALGDIRGGISVSFPVKFASHWTAVISHIIIALAGSALIFVFGSRLGETLRILEEQSNFDGLTQIRNRRYFDEHLEREYHFSKRNKTPLSIAICDLDNFKAFNDTYGHPSGDECLKAVAKALESVLKRPGDLVARYGGEEFGIILPYTTAEGALAVANLLLAKVETLKIPHSQNMSSDFVTVSIGIVTYNGDARNKNALLSSADEAMYAAKARGKNMALSA